MLMVVVAPFRGGAVVGDGGGLGWGDGVVGCEEDEGDGEDEEK